MSVTKHSVNRDKPSGEIQARYIKNGRKPNGKYSGKVSGQEC